jgi:uncharacterized protein (DUF302 family)
MIPEGLISLPSAFAPKETMDRLAVAVTKRGIAVLARINHAAAARQAGMELRPTEVLIFGNPRAGTPLMHAQQTMGIDLPLRALVYEDETGKTWVAYNDPSWLAVRHGISEELQHIVGAMAQTLGAVAHEAATKDNGGAV